MSCEASTPATVTLIELKSIIDRHFCPPFMPAGIVKTRWDDQGLQIVIGPREVTIKLDGTCGDTGASFLPQDQVYQQEGHIDNPEVLEAIQRAVAWGEANLPAGCGGFVLGASIDPDGNYLFPVEVRHLQSKILMTYEATVLQDVINQRRFDVVTRVVALAFFAFKKAMGFVGRWRMHSSGCPSIESMPPQEFLAQLKSGQIKLPDVEMAKTFADYEKEFPTEGPDWHAPSLEAFIESFQWPSAGEFADDVLKFIKDRKALAAAEPEHPINWDFPTVEAFVTGNYWWNAEDAIGDIRKFIKDRPAQATWTEAEIRAAYFSKADDHEVLTSEDDLIAALKGATADGALAELVRHIREHKA